MSLAEAEPAVGPWTDAHCHLADPRFEHNLEEVLKRSQEAGIVSWLQGGVDPADWQRQKQLHKTLGASMHMAFGLHPWWVVTASDQDIDDALARLEVELPNASALGELGLDKALRAGGSAEGFARQRRVFEAQLALARRVPKPLVLHVVRAHGAALDLLERNIPPRGGIVHAFTGSLEQARRYVDLGLLLSLGGGLLSRPERARELSKIPANCIVVETDAPDQAPSSWQVECNEPAYLLRIAEGLGPIWGLSATQLLDQTHKSMQTLLVP
jgi:TatD DNase family protein